jgi:predicted Fe-Mo cluster-binding NifX family protein
VDAPTNKTVSMVNAAFVSWQGRIAPLFDTSRLVHIVQARPCAKPVERIEAFPNPSPISKVLFLVEWGVSSLICGAISRHVQAIAAANGIQVISYIAGDVRAVIGAWHEGRLDDPLFKLPGCRPAV